APALKRQDAIRILAESPEPYRTMGIIAWTTGARPGELLALTVDDLDFENKTVRVDETADDRTRIRRKPKTKKSAALLPMPSALEAVLRNYLDNHWKPNPAGYLFANPDGTRPRSRDNVVKYWFTCIQTRPSN